MDPLEAKEMVRVERRFIDLRIGSIADAQGLGKS